MRILQGWWETVFITLDEFHLREFHRLMVGVEILAQTGLVDFLTPKTACVAEPVFSWPWPVPAVIA